MEETKMPVMDANNAKDPGTGAADSAKVHNGLKERCRIKLIAFVTLGLDGAEEPGLLEVLKRLIGQPPELLRMQGTLAQGGKQGTSTIEIFFGRHGNSP